MAKAETLSTSFFTPGARREIEVQRGIEAGTIELVLRNRAVVDEGSDDKPLAGCVVDGGEPNFRPKVGQRLSFTLYAGRDDNRDDWVAMPLHGTIKEVNEAGDVTLAIDRFHIAVVDKFMDEGDAKGATLF